MKKNLLILCSLVLGIMFVSSCSSDDDNESKVTRDYLTVSNATYTVGTFPAATSSQTLQGVSVKSRTIKIAKDQDYKRFFIGVKGTDGYWTYTPTAATVRKAKVRRAQTDDDEFYEIPVDFGNGDASTTLLISAEDESGNITKPYEATINLVDGQPSALVKSISVEDGFLSYNFSYDNQGRVTSISDGYNDSYSSRTTFSYDPLIITLYSGNRVKEVWYATTNDKGYVTSMTCNEDDWHGTQTFQYDNDGHMTQWSFKHTEGKKGVGDYSEDEEMSSFTWENGNMTKVNYVYTGHFSNRDIEDIITEKQTATMEYSNYPNYHQRLTMYIQNIPESYNGFLYLHNWDMIYLCTNLFGVGNKNLLSAQKFETNYDDEEFFTENFTLDYTFNEDGTIDTQTIKGGNYGTNGTTLKYEYNE